MVSVTQPLRAGAPILAVVGGQTALFQLMFMRQVVADGAAGGGAEQGVVVGKVTGDAADDGALDAAPRISGSGAGQQGEGQHHGKRFHVEPLWAKADIQL
jgi:hypothetical protein